MKILGIHSIWDDDEKMSAVDIWRVYAPLEELKKHVDWQIDYLPTFIEGVEKYKNTKEFTNEELEKAAEHLGQYDIVFSSYHPNPTAYVLMKVVKDKYGTEFVMDVDDDMFAVNPDNPFFQKVSHEGVFHMQRMIADNDWITTTTPRLAHEFRKRRDHKDDTVIVVPNYISDRYKPHSPNNMNKIVVGYFGGASHYLDLNETGVIPALERVMHENKRVEFQVVGQLSDKYTPKARTKHIDGKRGRKWYTELFPTLNFDISLAPIRDNQFNRCKSDIKWQESTRMGAAFIASDIGPYSELKHGERALLVNNTEEEWYKAIKRLVDDELYRKQLVMNSSVALADHTLEKNWNKYKILFEKVRNHENRKSSKKSIILQAD